ncbi:MAG: DNA-processing protein DprA [Chitinispirillaceae bacterium]|nr:DNA-processing protein DprA [Chitinispirillaceae bacterium]
MSLVEWIALNTINGLGPVRINRLLDHYISPEEVFKRPLSELLNSGLVPDSCCESFSGKAVFAAAEQQLDSAVRAGITILTLADKRYPPYLSEIFAPPPVLYIKGDCSVFSLHAMAVVGTRAPSVYGRKVTAAITRELVGSGLAIVSGMAYGVDTVAHQTCVDANGRTIGVLGCGIDHEYASRNPSLCERIVASGAIVSEFPLGTPPAPFNFPRRNRIISGLAAGTLVTEGSEKSGALITAHYALQQGRDVFAVPGPVTSGLSMGPFCLIRDGAIPARNGSEIACALSFIEHPQCRTESIPVPLSAPVNLLSGAERQLFETLSNAPMRIDELASALGQPIPQLFATLLNLELKGCARQVSGQQYVRSDLLTGA